MDYLLKHLPCLLEARLFLSHIFKKAFMFTLYPYTSLGHADHGWLDARHHFSFGTYRNPARTGFGKILVINDDIVAAGTGFGTHPHDNMEIITYVREGAITHRDSLGNEGRTEAGDVQVMSAGTGVRHSEHNHESVATRLYQIWIIPNQQNVTPRWEAQQFPKEVAYDKLAILASGMPQHQAEKPLFIHANAAIYGGKLKAGTQLTHPLIYPHAYILASSGNFAINGHKMQQGDGAELTDSPALTVHAQTDAEIVVIDVA
jgi:quercetin 2,3-dioxygenase